MGWIRISDDFYDNGKISLVGAHGMALYVAALGFCNRNLTDGLIPKGKAKGLVDFTGCAVMIGNYGLDDDCTTPAVDNLLAADLWHEQGHECPDCDDPGPMHYLIHDYLKFQPSKVQVEEKAAATRKRVEAWRAAQKNGNAVSNSVTNDVGTQSVTPSVHHTPNPTPTPTVITDVITEEGEPADRCVKHLNHTDPPPCHQCRKAREANEAWHAGALDRKRSERAAAKALSESCPTCQGTNWIPDTEPAVKCNHQEVS
jgi:hypothetical protein